MLVEVLGRVDLLYDAVLHHDDPGAQGHGLRLVVGNVDDGASQALMELGNLHTHLAPQFRIQVGERLIHEEDLGIPHDGASHGNPLALAAGEGPGLAV